MTEKNINPKTDTGRASNSVPEVDPVFSFTSGRGGDVYVYIVKSEIAKFAIIAFDDTSDEYAYSVQTLTGSPNLDAESLVSKAAKEWGERPNPFKQLRRNKKAMKQLAEIFMKVSET